MRITKRTTDIGTLTLRITKRTDVGTLTLRITKRTDVGTLTLLLVMLPVYALSSTLTVLRCMVLVSYVEGSYVEGP